MKILVLTDDRTWGISEIVEEDFHHATLALINAMVSYTAFSYIEVYAVSDDINLDMVALGSVEASVVSKVYSGDGPPTLNKLGELIEKTDSFFDDNLDHDALDEAYELERERNES